MKALYSYNYFCVCDKALLLKNYQKYLHVITWRITNIIKKYNIISTNRYLNFNKMNIILYCNILKINIIY